MSYLITQSAVARALQTTPYTVRKLVDQGHIPAVRMSSNRFRFDPLSVALALDYLPTLEGSKSDTLSRRDPVAVLGASHRLMHGRR